VNDETLEQIQSKIAFLERANSDLSDVLFRQQREIRALSERIRTVSDRLHALQSEDGQRSPEEERPPHY